MQWTATERIPGLTAAPGGLAFIQDFLNSDDDGVSGERHRHDDLFSHIETARNWMTKAVESLSDVRGLELPPPELSERDLPRLIELRRELRLLVSVQASADDMDALPR